MRTFTVTPTMIISPAKVKARAGQIVQLRHQGQFNIEWIKMDAVLSQSATQTLDGVLEVQQVRQPMPEATAVWRLIPPAPLTASL